MEHREESDRMQSLNGTWKFRYFDSIYDVQETFLRRTMTYSETTRTGNLSKDNKGAGIT